MRDTTDEKDIFPSYVMVFPFLLFSHTVRDCHYVVRETFFSDSSLSLELVVVGTGGYEDGGSASTESVSSSGSCYGSAVELVSSLVASREIASRCRP